MNIKELMSKKMLLNRKILIMSAVLAIALVTLAIGLKIFSSTGYSTAVLDNMSGINEQSEVSLTIKVGYVPVLVNLPLFVAIEEGYFTKYNLTVDAIEVQSPNYIVDGMLSGRLDGAGVLAYTILFVAEEKYPGKIKLFQTAEETKDEYVSAILVGKNSTIRSIEDLRHKKIGVYSGIVQVLLLKSILIGMNINPEKDIEIIEVEPRLQLEGLNAGYYDALSTVEPYPAIAKEKNIGRILIENPRVRFIQDPFPSVAVSLSYDYIEKNPKASKAYILAMNDAVEFIKRNPEKAKLDLIKYTPIDANSTQSVRLLKFNAYGNENTTRIQMFADWMTQNKLLNKKINIVNMFNCSDFLQLENTTEI